MEREVDGTSCSQAYAPFMMCLCTFAALDLRPERANQWAVKTAPWHMNLFRRHIEKILKYCDIFTCHVFPTIRFCSILLKTHFWNLDIRSCQCWGYDESRGPGNGRTVLLWLQRIFRYFQCLHMIELLGSNFALNHFLWLNLSLVPWLSVFFLSILNGFHCAIPAAYV